MVGEQGLKEGTAKMVSSSPGKTAVTAASAAATARGEALGSLKVEQQRSLMGWIQNVGKDAKMVWRFTLWYK